MSIWKRLGRVGRGKAKVWGQTASEAFDALTGSDAAEGGERESIEAELRAAEAELYAASEASRAKRTGDATADLARESTPAPAPAREVETDEFGFKEYKPKKRTL